MFTFSKRRQAEITSAFVTWRDHASQSRGKLKQQLDELERRPNLIHPGWVKVRIFVNAPRL